jgi:Mg/Co/Ni transporter MgtE
MQLVGKKKGGKPGQWEVYWSWLPYFLAADVQLIKSVDKKLTKVLAESLNSWQEEDLIEELSQTVLFEIMKKYPMRGLDHYLFALDAVQPEISDWKGPDNEPVV